MSTRVKPEPDFNSVWNNIAQQQQTTVPSDSQTENLTIEKTKNAAAIPLSAVTMGNNPTSPSYHSQSPLINGVYQSMDMASVLEKDMLYRQNKQKEAMQNGNDLLDLLIMVDNTPSNDHCPWIDDPSKTHLIELAEQNGVVFRQNGWNTKEEKAEIVKQLNRGKDKLLEINKKEAYELNRLPAKIDLFYNLSSSYEQKHNDMINKIAQRISSR